jgi:NitT/TauT family transport system permease protein
MSRTFHKALFAVILPLAGVAFALLLVEWLKMKGSLPRTVPAPSEVWTTFLSRPGAILGSLKVTATNAAIGYAYAAGISLIGAAIATFIVTLRPQIYNLGVGLHSIPLIATTPLLALWLGNGPSTHVLIAAMASFFPMLVAGMQGFRAYERSHMELFHVLSAAPWQRFRYLVLPSSLPYLFAGFKLAAPLAVLGCLTAEWTGAEYGLGVLLLHALFSFDVKVVWMMVIITCALSALSYAMWALVERVAIYWDTSVELRG